MAAGTTFLPAVVTIADLPTGTTLTGGELMEAVQTVAGLQQSIQVTLASVAALAYSGAHFFPATALPVSGASTMGLTLSSAVALGLFAGTGAPTFAAATSSLYLRFDASNATNRIYVNTNGATNWTSVPASG